MIIIWLATLFYIIIGFLMQYYVADTAYLTFSFIILTVVVMFFVLFINYTKFVFILFTGFILRIIILLVDLGEGKTIIPHSGDDSENFYKTGIEISMNTGLLNTEVYGGLYSKLLGILFYLYGDDRLFVQFLNIVVTMTVILIVIQIFRMLDIPGLIQMILVALLAFYPHSLIFSSILVRESMISMTVVLSLYFFIRWFKYGGAIYAVLSVLAILAGASFHTAVIGILFGYLFGFIFYNHTERTLKFSVESVVPFTVFAVITTYIIVFPDVVSGLPIANKVDQVLTNNDNVYEAVTSARGDTAYLANLEVNNLFQLLLLSPVKVVYFITSPMPWNISNFNELISFLLDGVFYLTAMIIFIKNFHLVKSRPILAILLISIFAGWFIFGLGISNAGTALRHRFKFFYIVIVALGIIWSKRTR